MPLTRGPVEDILDLGYRMTVWDLQILNPKLVKTAHYDLAVEPPFFKGFWGPLNGFDCQLDWI